MNLSGLDLLDLLLHVVVVVKTTRPDCYLRDVCTFDVLVLTFRLRIPDAYA